MALNVNHPDDLGDKIQEMFHMLSAPKDSLMDKLRLLPKLGEIGSWAPTKLKGRGLCQKIEMPEVDLSQLPVLTTWPHDGGPFITFPVGSYSILGWNAQCRHVSHAGDGKR